MKTISERTLDSGKRRMTIELNEHESTLIAVDSRCHYMLGEPLDDVVAPHILAAVKEVTWCSVQQKWIS